MTEPIKLPPIPDEWHFHHGDSLTPVYDHTAMQDYACLAVEQATAALRERAEKAEAERDEARAELARLTTPNMYWHEDSEDSACEELGEVAQRIADNFFGDDRECITTVTCARSLPSVQMRVWINDEGDVDFECPLPEPKEADK